MTFRKKLEILIIRYIICVAIIVPVVMLMYFLLGEKYAILTAVTGGVIAAIYWLIIDFKNEKQNNKVQCGKK